jgi:hypothetical protein
MRRSEIPWSTMAKYAGLHLIMMWMQDVTLVTGLFERTTRRLQIANDRWVGYLVSLEP